MITALMKRFDMGPLLAAHERYESRIEEGRAKIPEAIREHRRVEDLRSKLGSVESVKARDLYSSALRHVAH